MVMQANDLSLAKNVRVLGSGEKTVVMAHGYGGDQSIWDKVLPHLAQTHQVVAFDWNFSGPVEDYSSFDAFADDLISLIESLGFHEVFYVGHSMSGMIGCVASIKRPELFESLILVGASPRYLNSEGYDGGFERSDIDTILSHIKSNFQAWAVNFASMVVDMKDPLSVEKFGKSLHKMGPEVALSLAKTIFLSDLTDVLDKVEVPSTIVQASNDPVVPMPVAYYMQKKIKGKASIEVIKADGHFPQLTAHESFIRVLDKAIGF